jgi:hypothetical protein
MDRLTARVILAVQIFKKDRLSSGFQQATPSLGSGIPVR